MTESASPLNTPTTTTDMAKGIKRVPTFWDRFLRDVQILMIGIIIGLSAWVWALTSDWRMAAGFLTAGLSLLITQVGSLSVSDWGKGVATVVSLALGAVTAWMFIDSFKHAEKMLPPTAFVRLQVETQYGQNHPVECPQHGNDLAFDCKLPATPTSSSTTDEP